MQRDASLGWIGDAAENFEQRALAGTVAVSLLNFEAHVSQHQVPV